MNVAARYKVRREVVSVRVDEWHWEDRAGYESLIRGYQRDKEEIMIFGEKGAGTERMGREERRGGML